LSLPGGAAGIAMGLAVSRIFAWPVRISPAAILGGFLFATAVGIFFGFYPARKAARLDLIEALRYE
jgi:macrolide transport system ATP-binding/permease protein